MDPDAAAVVTTDTPRRHGDVLALFAMTWAIATLFHVWGSSGAAFRLFSHRTTLGLWQALASIVAAGLLIRPRSIPLLSALAVLGPITLWYEMPVAGSHWVLACLVDVALLLALVAARGRDRIEPIFVPLARCVLVGFYFFAAFAKLNHSFFTPSASCGNFYLDELSASLHLSVHSATAGWWSHLVPVAVAATEMSIPILLCVRRTRYVGVVVGLLFHGMIALDQTHQFSDFSSVLVPLFLLFLPATFASNALARVRDELKVLAAGAAVVMLLVQWKQGAARVFVDALGWGWVVYIAVVLVLVAQFLRDRPAPIEHPFGFASNGVPRWLAVVPLLVLVTGLSPYLELRTAYAFNMYSNLQTADGESNHLLVTRTFPVTDFQSDPVRVTATNDLGLQRYIGAFDIPFLQLRDYLSRRPQAALTYVRAGVEHTVIHASDDPALVEPVPAWESKLFAFRSIDQTDPTECQPVFLPAL